MTKVLSIQRILLALGILVFLGAAIVGATGAFFSDTETSTGNTFSAGALDLKVDSEAHYNGYVCRPDLETTEQGDYTWQGEGRGYPGGLPCEGTWSETDLGVEHQFFNLSDIKPGDEGENTISLHVYDNDAWGRFLVKNVANNDNGCTEPEGNDADDVTCGDGQGLGGGELSANIYFSAWLDQGFIPGFQNMDAQGNPVDANPTEDGIQLPDPAEGNNIQDDTNLEQLFWFGETVNDVAEGPFELSDVLEAAYNVGECEDVDGNTNYDVCHGLAEDGRMVGSTTYYFGLGWNVPDSVGNIIQTDSLVTDLEFQVEQHRNNPTPFI